MKSINGNSKKRFYTNACIAMIWLVVFYASIIQYVVKEIPYGMLFIGVAILLFYYLIYSEESYNIRKELPEESLYMLLFMAYMFIIGTLVAIDKSGHLSQAITSLEFLIILIVISSLIKGTGTESFHLLLLLKALVLAVIFLMKPVEFSLGRYSIHADVNPNGLGMSFVTGIWAVLYRQQNKKLPLIFTAALIALFGYCIINTGSRKSLIAMGLIVGLWLFFCFFPSIKERGGYYGLLSFFAIIVLIIAVWKGFTWLYSESTLSNRMGNLLYETTEGKRSEMYQEGLEIIKSNPLFGIGFQGFSYLYGKYSHATIVEIPVSGGIIGALIYFYIYYISIRRTLELYRRTKNESDFHQEHLRIRMLIPLWAAMLFFITCIIHIYLFDSFVAFGIVFGETSYIESKLPNMVPQANRKAIGNKYFKYSDRTAYSNEKAIGSKYIK